MNPFENFVRFIECELALSAIEKEKKLGEKDLQNGIEQLDREHEKIDLLKKRVMQLQKDMHAYELESRGYVQREKDARQRLEITRNAKEYAACQHELEELEHMRDACEDRLLETLGLYEAAQKEYVDRREELEAGVEKQQAIVTEKREHIHALDVRHSQTVEKCIELRKSVNPEFLEKYERMKRVVADPFVPVSGQYCSACNFQIAQKDLIDINKHLFVECKNCYRMVYEPV